jgi:hydroxyacylglutathione hydrolase
MGARALARIGYDQVAGYLAGVMAPWAVSGRSVGRVAAMDGPEFKQRRESGSEFILLDVRAQPEFDQGHLEGATHVYLGELPERLGELEPHKEIITFCGSGQRALIAASVLERAGFEKVTVNWGSMGAWQALGGGVETY